jgi:hypothetical protein
MATKQKVKSTTVDFGQSEMDYPAPSKQNNYLQDYGFKNGYKPVSAGTKGKIQKATTKYNKLRKKIYKLK